MTEQEEREQIKVKIIEDIDYLKKNENEIRTALVKIFPNSQDAISVDIALNTLKMNGTSYLDTGTLETLKTFYTNIINQFTIVSRAFLSDISNKNSQNKLIESAKGFNEFTNSISIKDTPKEINFQLKHDGGVGLSQEFDKIYLRINNLENRPNEITDTLNKNLNDVQNSSKSAKEYVDKIQTLHTNAQYYNENLKTEFDNLKIKSNELLNHNISMVLSDQFHDKAKFLNTEAEKKLGLISWKPWKLSGFYGATAILLLVNLISWIVYFTVNSEIEFWHFMMLKLTINIPLIIYLVFTLNEYMKAKKLYEEFDYKRIMSITLVNNYDRLKNELGLGQDKAFELIKTPFEKIFDNPVHSIYGDKSGDKNIGLDQLEKITSIIEKMKK